MRTHTTRRSPLTAAEIVESATAALLAATTAVLLLAGCSSGMRYTRDYATLLAASPPFATHPDQPEIDLRFQDSSSPDLVELKRDYRLEEIAGTGPDPDRIIRLMEWVHRRTPHNGTSNPPVSNTREIITYFEETGEGVNCRLLATVLSEVYLACGYPARPVSCLPEEREFTDSHVVAEVWLEDEQRWIMMDPSFNAYVTDDHGRILGVREFREGLSQAAAGAASRLHLNDDADWNGNPYRQSDYFAYMTKNLYRLHATADSRYDFQRAGRDYTYVNLVPAGYQPVGAIERTLESGSRITYLITSDADSFWVAP